MKQFILWTSNFLLSFATASLVAIVTNTFKLSTELNIMLWTSDVLFIVLVIFMRKYIRIAELVNSARDHISDRCQRDIIRMSSDIEELARYQRDILRSLNSNSIAGATIGTALARMQAERMRLEEQLTELNVRYMPQPLPFLGGSGSSGGSGGGGGGSGRLESQYRNLVQRIDDDMMRAMGVPAAMIRGEQVSLTYPMPPFERPKELPPTVTHETRLDL